MKIEATQIFEKNYEAFIDKQYTTILNQGGSRSSKTYSILQLLIVIALKYRKHISIIRKSFPTLRGSVMRDWLDIMISMEIYDENNHSKTENIYKFDNGSIIEFFSLDDSQKIRGRKRDILYINEANEIDFESWIQLKMRTREKVLIDYNPSEIDHWTYDILKEKTSILIKSTYKDNPFLTEEQVKYIENLINVDEYYYKIYTLGERVKPTETIFKNINFYDVLPENTIKMYGVDFGFNDPSTIVEVNFYDTFGERRLYLKEILYESYLKPQEIVDRFNLLIKDKNTEIWADHRPEYIDMLLDEGFNIKKAYKDIKEGIGWLMNFKIYIHVNSKNIIKEFNTYKWKKVNDIVLDVPVDFMNHSIDATRYAAMGMKKIGVEDWNLLF